ncbi:hypothetical protein [Pseudomonas syringae]|uniref:hypothetical protein n=1 Tax=Pseudomonas TaxID=286 RepID=UPI000CD1ADF4|nr:hypothetical protein [Pseudomonas syringae]MCF5032250.1 hypothetical protein [Pseudomonas syringae]POD16335.1 hypothetical protein BKM12_20715 [Pseudomonas syringae pv. syringae]UQB20030.1 hypothetical protein I9H08_24595 [Pseudomonas syringae pv. syringae]
MINTSLQSALRRLKLSFSVLALVTISACSNTKLEEQFRGIEACQIKNIYLDPVTKKASGAYFTERKLEPCRVDEAAFYCVNDTFYGLAVNQIAIPYKGPFSVHAIYLEDSPATVEATLKAKFTNIKINQKDGMSPVLIANPKHQGSSVFYCDEYSE